MTLRVRKVKYACDLCGRKFDYPTGVHTDATGNRWCLAYAARVNKQRRKKKP